MSQESRTRKTFLNARVNLIFYFLTLLLSFFSRKIFLDILGADFIGLTGTLQNLLSFLNLAELGIGTAVGYVFKNDWSLPLNVAYIVNPINEKSFVNFTTSFAF